MNVYLDLIFTSADNDRNWFKSRYYYQSGNARYYTFQIALNLLRQCHENPVIIETGCQRQEEDVGAGMSTSIFAEYISRYGGKLISVDIVDEHLKRAKSYVSKWPAADVTMVRADSVGFLQQHQGSCDLLYLDSLDYPVGEEGENLQLRDAAQQHCMNEFRAAQKNLETGAILLLDDNHLPGGGKPRLVKEYLLQQPEWLCVMDYQQSLWIKS